MHLLPDARAHGVQRRHNGMTRTEWLIALPEISDVALRSSTHVVTAQYSEYVKYNGQDWLIFIDAGGTAFKVWARPRALDIERGVRLTVGGMYHLRWSSSKYGAVVITSV